ncbi:MAG: signal peptidase I [Turicibacter sp.]
MKRILLEIFDWIKTFVIIFLIVTIVHKYVFTPVKVDGPSMYPTLHDEDSVILWELNYKPKLFDVIVFEFSEDVYYVKRVMGMPGQTVDYREDKLYIDGQYVEEPFLEKGKQIISYLDPFTFDFTLEEICQLQNCTTIPEGYYLVLGDNRPNSKDSRHIGLVSEKQIMGKATWIQWPLANFGQIQ